MVCVPLAHATHSARMSRGPAGCLSCFTMDTTIKIALVGTGMFGGDVHARAYADLQRAGISPQLGRVGLDAWARDLGPIKFQLAAVAARTEKSARRARQNFKRWTGHAPKAFAGQKPWLDILREFPDLDVMAVATPDPLYIVGNYNVTTNTNGVPVNLGTGNTSQTYPAAVTEIDRVLNPNTTLTVTAGIGQSVLVQGWADVLSTGASLAGF